MRQAELFESSSSKPSPAFPATKQEALRRWEDFRALLSRYGAERNRVLPGHPYVSRLSPALRCRLILESELVEGALQNFAFSTVEKFVQEVLWRSYWKAWLENRPEVWAAYREELTERQETLTKASLERIQQVQAGQSGVAVIDKFTRELLTTGYMHNHARMWWASYWIHVEKLPWVLGADFFYRHLLDADPASNTLSWRWVAGLQTRGKTYLIRRSNLEKYCAPELLEDRSGLDKLEDGAVEPTIPEDWPLKSAKPDSTLNRSLFPSPQENKGAKWAWWLHGEDLHVKTARLLLPANSPQSIRAFISNALCEHFKLGPARVTYMKEALHDGLARAQHLCDFETFQEPTFLPKEISLSEAITTWAGQEQIDEVWTVSPFVGPLRDELPQIERSLREKGKKLCLVTRAWDRDLLPLAKGGYFGFWERMKKKLS